MSVSRRAVAIGLVAGTDLEFASGALVLLMLALPTLTARAPRAIARDELN